MSAMAGRALTGTELSRTADTSRTPIGYWDLGDVPLVVPLAVTESALVADQEAGIGAFYLLADDDSSVLGRFNLELAQRASPNSVTIERSGAGYGSKGDALVFAGARDQRIADPCAFPRR